MGQVASQPVLLVIKTTLFLSDKKEPAFPSHLFVSFSSLETLNHWMTLAESLSFKQIVSPRQLLVYVLILYGTVYWIVTRECPSLTSLDNCFQFSHSWVEGKIVLLMWLTPAGAPRPSLCSGEVLAEVAHVSYIPRSLTALPVSAYCV